MILSFENLETGINWWQANVKEWGRDLINSEYKEIYDQRNGGITDEWWQDTVHRLWGWRAIRSSRPPNTIAQILENGRARIEKIAECFDAIRALTSAEPSMPNVNWEDIQALFSLCNEIKWENRRVSSPVFAFKMCHFMFPMIFPVIDNYATGLIEYEFYWRGMKCEWRRFPSKDVARQRLESVIRPDRPHDLYPWETKIMELCHIGYAHAEPKTPTIDSA